MFKLNKKTLLWLLLQLVFLIVFNIVFFVTSGTVHPASVWVSYGFIHFAYIMLMITPLLVRKTTNTAVFGYPLNAISTAYFIIAFLVGVGFIIAHPESYIAALVTQIILLGIYAVLLLSHMIANEETADSIERHEMDLEYVKDASSHLKRISESIDDKQFYKKVERLYDLLHASPVKTNASVRDFELSVLGLIDELEMYIANNDYSNAELTINKIERNANERNRRLKYDN